MTTTIDRGLKARWVRRGDADVRGDATGEIFDRVVASRRADEAFLSPLLSQLHDPSSMPDLDRAASRLLEALRRDEQIVIYGDYDVDGITATTILYHMMKAIAPDARVRTYIPHRLEEGYGLNVEAMHTLCDDGATCIVSVDCGITGHEAADACRSRGCDLIITDHHHPPATIEDLPDAFAVVHPRHPASSYPFGDLCGAGVAYKLAWRLATLHSGADRAHAALRELLVDLLGVCALGVIADVVPLVGENRVIAHYGLGRVRGSRIVGLQALVEASGLDRVDAEAVGFRLAPRLNAAGRLGHAREALELLTVADEARSKEIATALTDRNEERRVVERRILAQAEGLASSEGMFDRRGIVLAHEDWHPGVVGIVCSRLVDRHHRPTILMQRGELCTGSGRSIEGFNLHGAIEACASHLEGFGGHEMAAGLRVRSESFEDFRDAFLSYCDERLGEEDLVATAEYDADVKVEELSIGTIRSLQRLAPFGRSNPPVRLRLRGVTVERALPFGSGGDHLGVQVRCGNRWLRLVGWNWARHRESLRQGASIEALIEPQVSSYSGKVEPILVDAMVL